jgi:hypothetical protein
MMKYEMTRPCANCPFRNDIRPYLRPARVEEIASGAFPCHKTVDYDDEGEYSQGCSEKEQHCAGSLILHEKMGQSHQMMRIAERLGFYDRTKLDMDSPVYDDLDEMIDAHDAAQED